MSLIKFALCIALTDSTLTYFGQFFNYIFLIFKNLQGAIMSFENLIGWLNYDASTPTIRYKQRWSQSPITISIKLSLKLSHCSIFLVLNSFPIFKGVCWNPLKHPHYKILHNKTFLVKICDFAMHSFLLITPSSNLLRNQFDLLFLWPLMYRTFKCWAYTEQRYYLRPLFSYCSGRLLTKLYQFPYNNYFPSCYFVFTFTLLYLSGNKVFISL